MPDTQTPPTTPTPTTPRTRGYFNQSQIEDLELADIVIASARGHIAAMTEQDITPTWLDSFEAALQESRDRSTDASHGGDESKLATAAAARAAKALTIGLQKIQSAAKQKHKMLAEDGDPATNFPTDGYLIGSRLNGSRANLLQRLGRWGCENRPIDLAITNNRILALWLNYQTKSGRTAKLSLLNFSNQFRGEKQRFHRKNPKEIAR